MASIIVIEEPKGDMLGSYSLSDNRFHVNETGEWFKQKIISGHHKAITSVSWSSENHQLTCAEEAIIRWDVASGACLQVYGKIGFGITSCEWSPDGTSIFASLTDDMICWWQLDGIELASWKGQSTQNSDLEISTDGKLIISICRTGILLHDLEGKVERFLEEQQQITSFSLSRDSRFLLVTLLNQERRELRR
ncbi:hypothetical protein GQ457_06G042030 [Hibiscus cannabinus]